MSGRTDRTTQLDDVQQGLLLPRVGDGRAVIETVNRDAARAQTCAPEEHHRRRETQANLRHGDIGQREAYERDPMA